MDRNLFFRLLLFFLSLNRLGHSQTLPFYFQSLNQTNGLSEQTNPYFSQDSKGYLWIGSFDGLNRFDGKQVKIYRPTLPNGTYSPNVTSKVFEDPKGRRWFSTSGGIHCILPETDILQTITLPSISQGQSVNDEYVLVHLDNQSKLWIIAQNWLHLYDPATKKDSLLHPIQTYSCYPIIDGHGKVTGLVSLLIDQGGGFELFDYRKGEVLESTWLTGREGPGFPKTLILFANVEADSILWLPTQRGLIRFPIGSPRRMKIYNPPELNVRVNFWDAAVYKNDFLLLTSTNQGIFLFDKRLGVKGFIGHQPCIRQKEEPTGDTIVNNIFIGREGSLWLSVWGKGVFFSNLEQLKFQTQLQVSGQHTTKSLPVTSIMEDKERNVWTTSDEGNIMIKSPSGQISTQNPNRTGLFLDKLFCDQVGDVWAFNGSSVFLKKRKTKGFKELATHLDRLYNILQLSRNNFLFVCPTGVYEFNKDNLDKQQTTLPPLLIRQSSFDAFTDSHGRLFLSDEVDKISIYTYRERDLRLEQEITGVGYSNGMVEDHNIRWFVSNKGLLKLDIRNFSFEFVKGQGRILKTSFNAILQDRGGHLWLSSNAGLFQYDPASGTVKHYTESDGLQGLQFMPGSACRFSDGRLAFGGVNGLNIFQPDSVRDNPIPPILHFTDWIINDTGSISASPDYLPRQSFSYDNRTLSFHFVGIDYTAPDEVQYKYRLEGFEKDTVDAGTHGFARYAQLPAGDYTFQVWAANSDGIWTDHPQALRFTIRPPWYATWPARILQILLLLGLLYAFYRNRIARVRRKESERRKEAEFRQKEAESRQLAAELQNSVLRLQMNPHFIFNSMNSISSYILQKDIDTANDYLGRFARLMRSILDLAARPLIPIADEIDLLEQYMAAEAMRLEKKFTWQVEVDPELDPEETLLPTMILQPFVENAIWHGFSGKETAGHVHICFRKEEHHLFCSVRDNGIGRLASRRYGAETHQSKALQITQQRLQLIAGQGGAQTSLETVDLYDATGSACGTQVEIGLPLDL